MAKIELYAWREGDVCEVAVLADTDDPALLRCVSGCMKEILDNPQGAEVHAVAEGGTAADLRGKIEHLRLHFSDARLEGRPGVAKL